MVYFIAKFKCWIHIKLWYHILFGFMISFLFNIIFVLHKLLQVYINQVYGSSLKTLREFK